MSKRLLFLVASCLLASSGLAAPVVTSMTPNSGTVAGGTHVIIRGTGFSNDCTICSPPFVAPGVSFGVLRSPSVQFIDSTTLDAVTPPTLPGTYAVTVGNHDGSGFTIVTNAFTFTGDINEAFEPILFPIFMAPVFGAFNSEFHTNARVFNKVPDSFVYLYGESTLCYLIEPASGPSSPLVIGTAEVTLLPNCSTSPGRILWARKGSGGFLAANLRVADVTREATGHGTEIPVVRSNDFTTDKIALLGVPGDPRFRLTLRIYSLARTDGPVNIEGLNRQVFLTPGRDMFEPSYAEVSDLPRTLTRVVIFPAGVPLWALITVTNNDTQQITTITPN